jgi:hypothetical protein
LRLQMPKGKLVRFLHSSDSCEIRLMAGFWVRSNWKGWRLQWIKICGMWNL